VPAFRLWRAQEIVELTSVKLKLDGGHLYKVPVDEIIQSMLMRHGVRGTYSDPKNITDGDQSHMVYFLADPKMRSSLGQFQKGSGKFYLNLWGMDRELYMARDPLVVAAEEAAVMRLRVETALAKAIAASDRLALVSAETAAATTGGVEEPPKQQQGNSINNHNNNSLTCNTVNRSYLGPVAPAMSDFMRKYQQVQQDHREQRERQQQQQQEQQQQPPAAGLEDYHAWAAKNLPDQQQQPTTTTTTTTQQQQQQQQGKATFSIINYLTDKQTTNPPGVVKERIASIEELVA
jgi:hypothetical protein